MGDDQVRFDPGHCNMVVVGAWNQTIFTPEWVARVLKPNATDENMSMQVGLSDVGGVIIQFATTDFLLTVAPGQLTVGAGIRARDQPQNDCKWLSSLEDVTAKIIGVLEHTPLKAFGLNFRVVVTQPSDRLRRLLAADEQQALEAAGFVLQQSSVGRRIAAKGSSDAVLNVKLTRELSGSIAIDVNHHRDVEDASRAASALKGTMNKDLEITRKLIAAAYGVEAAL